MITDYIDKIFCGDSLEIMRELPDGCCDIAVTSPPYNLKNSTGNGMKCGKGGKWANAALIKGYAEYNDDMPYELYCKWQRECLTEMMRLIRDAPQSRNENANVLQGHSFGLQRSHKVHVILQFYEKKTRPFERAGFD